MLHAILTLTLMSATQFDPHAINGVWKGRFNWQAGKSTCESKLCDIPRGVEIEFRGGMLVWGQDMQTMTAQANGSSLFQTVTDVNTGVGQKTTFIWSYNFGVMPTGKLLAAMQYQAMTTSGGAVLDKGCTCLYLAVLERDKT